MKLHLARLAVLASSSLLACRHDTATEAPFAAPTAVAPRVEESAPTPTPAAPTANAQADAHPAATPPEAAPASDAPPTEAPPAEPPSLLTVDGANATVSETEADGLHLTELACAVDRPLLGTLAVIGALSKQAAAFDRCAPRGDAAILHWAFVDGRPQEITVRGASSKKAEACLVAALKKVRSPLDARCGAVLHVGDESGAREAHARLSASE